MNLDPSQLEVANQGMEKRNGLPTRFHQRERDLAIRDAERDAGNACSRSNVGHALRSRREERPEKQRVKKETTADRRACAESCEVMRAVPEEQQIGVTIEGLPLGRRRRSSQEGREGLEEIV